MICTLILGGNFTVFVQDQPKMESMFYFNIFVCLLQYKFILKNKFYFIFDYRQYIRGSEVLLKIKDLELSTEFLGSTTGLTLLEADAFIIKLLKSPLKETS